MAFDPSNLMPSVLQIVRESGAILREHHDRPRAIRHKGRIDLVTETDLAVEQFLKHHLKECLPEADFLAEESAEGVEPGSFSWVIDPVDGTTNFAHGLPLVATSVALWRQGKVVLGVVNAPLLQECFWAVRGQGAYCNGKPIRVSEAAAMEQALVATGFPYAIEGELAAILRRMEQILPRSQGIRRCGAAALDMAWVAAGRFDLFYETLLKPWDMAAGWLLVEEAGGRVSHFDGTEQSISSGEVLATNGKLHAVAQCLLQG